MSDDAIFIVGIGIASLIAGAIGLGRKTLQRRRIRRRLASVLPLTADTATGELARVTGIVRVAVDPIAAPLTGRRCVVARSRVHDRGVWTLFEYARDPKESIMIVAFTIESELGLVEITGETAVLDLPLHQVDATTDPELRIRRLQLAHDKGFPPSDAKHATFSESLVIPGMTVTVAGRLTREPLRLAGDVHHPLVIGRPVDRDEGSLP